MCSTQNEVIITGLHAYSSYKVDVASDARGERSDYSYPPTLVTTLESGEPNRVAAARARLTA